MVLKLPKEGAAGTSARHVVLSALLHRLCHIPIPPHPLSGSQLPGSPRSMTYPQFFPKATIHAARAPVSLR